MVDCSAGFSCRDKIPGKSRAALATFPEAAIRCLARRTLKRERVCWCSQSQGTDYHDGRVMLEELETTGQALSSIRKQKEKNAHAL